jgi:hypothetical protein
LPNDLLELEDWADMASVSRGAEALAAAEAEESLAKSKVCTLLKSIQPLFVLIISCSLSTEIEACSTYEHN